MSSYLLIDGPGLWAYQHALKNGKVTQIGRSPKCEVKLNDGSVSGFHAQVVHANGSWVIRDNQSSNGTLVNDQPIVEHSLRHGDKIRIGKTELVFHAPDQETAGDFLDRTQVLFSKQEQAIRGAIRQAGPNDMVQLPPPVAVVPSPTPVPAPPFQYTRPAAPTVAPTVRPGASAPTPPPPPPPRATVPCPDIPNLIDIEVEESVGDFHFDPDRYAKAAVAAGGREKAAREDMLWVAEKAADILAAMATFRGKGRRAIQDRALQLIKDAIGAENGFLMVADRIEKRWVIRAWVGDADEWTNFEKQHPVPLTAANQAFKEDRIVSNALGSGDHSKSESMLMMSVHCYVAVPLHRSGIKEGLLYFDTRRSLKVFADRDVKLLERIGAYILQMETPSQAV